MKSTPFLTFGLLRRSSSERPLAASVLASRDGVKHPRDDQHYSPRARAPSTLGKTGLQVSLRRPTASTTLEEADRIFSKSALE